jgi:hypothetical protein
MERAIGVPTMRTMQSAFADYAIGAAGGLIFLLSQAILGSGLIGSLAAPVLAGSIVKGARGTALATIAGFMALVTMMSGATSGANSTSQPGVI